MVNGEEEILRGVRAGRTMRTSFSVSFLFPALCCIANFEQLGRYIHSIAPWLWTVIALVVSVGSGVALR